MERAGTRLDRRAAVATAVVAGLVLTTLALWLVPWDWVPGGRLVPMPEHRLFSSAQISEAEQYATWRRALGWSSYFLSLLIALLLGITSWGARLVRRLTGGARWWLAVPLGALALLLIGRLLTVPFGVGLWRLNTRYGLTNQPLGDWAVDQLKGLLVSWVITSLLLLVLVGCARRSPRHWFAWAGGVAAVLTFAGSYLYPVVVEPLFNNFTSMSDGAFKESIFRLADREGVHIDDVLVADASRRTTTLNAYVSGIGSTRRVVVYDNLLRDLTPNEARVVIAHELGHAKDNDVLIGTTLGAAGGVLGVAVLALLMDTGWLRRRAGVEGPSDPGAIAVLLALLALGGFLVSPVQNGVSRAIEARADRAALAATDQPKVFIRMQHELAVKGLADSTPPALSQFWFGSHPTVLQRAGLPSSIERSR